jgi:hypothetical protein
LINDKLAAECGAGQGREVALVIFAWEASNKLETSLKRWRCPGAITAFLQAPFLPAGDLAPGREHPDTASSRRLSLSSVGG